MITNNAHPIRKVVIYREQQRVKSMRHEIGNNLISISGLLKHDKIHEAIEKINEISVAVEKATDIVDTGSHHLMNKAEGR